VGKNINRIALAFISGTLLLSILWPYEQKLLDWDKAPEYRVLESDEIYFNNTRIVAYRTEESKELTAQGFKTHRSTKALLDTTVAFVNFTIVNNWRADKAYIVMEPSDRKFFRSKTQVFCGQDTLDFDLDHMDFEQHYALAAKLFKHYLDYERPFIYDGKDSLLLYGTQGNEKANTTVLKDYFRLVGRFQ